ncbi:unnamed protein product [Phytomonas sp. EM1]|nr:unnamed protein product [Phytomonas sp. EM1]|eukprot:CCW63866.1 unnamed protein product [Phytomonas sp. isolate EM1]
MSASKTTPAVAETALELPTTKRRSRKSSSSSNHGIISDATILRGVRKEFLRTLPFWRCYVDMKRRVKSNPVLLGCEISLLCRLPCEVFSGVDVVWAATEARIQVKIYLKRPRSDDRAVSDPHPGAEASPSRVWRAVRLEEHRWKLGTMHFVHHDAHHNGKGDSRSYHIQSVLLTNQPEVMQCVAGTMVSFAFLTYSSLMYLDHKISGGAGGSPVAKKSSSEDPTPMLSNGGGVSSEVGGFIARFHAFCPPPLRRVLILGMGGNSIAVSLRYALGAAVELHVVEIEPAVVRACERAGTLPKGDDDGNFHVHLEDAVRCLKGTLATTLFDMIFMDLFEPTEGKMRSDMRIANLCFDRLLVGGLLVVNLHQLPSLASLRPFGRLFGMRNVQAVDLHGWNESVIVGMKSAMTPDWRLQRDAPKGEGEGEGGGSRECSSRDGLVLQCSKRLASVVLECYEEKLPGWLLHPSWLKGSKKVGHGNEQCRIWDS